MILLTPMICRVGLMLMFVSVLLMAVKAPDVRDDSITSANGGAPRTRVHNEADKFERETPRGRPQNTMFEAGRLFGRGAGTSHEFTHRHRQTP